MKQGILLTHGPVGDAMIEAVRTIMGWYRKGLDPDREMLRLTTYLGHLKPDHTYWYIEAVPALMQLASKRAERSLAAGAAGKGGAR